MGWKNLCWSCHRCNFNKGPNLSSIDPQSNQVVRLFDPRRQSWHRHFQWEGPYLIGLTKTGRATIALLDINEPQRDELRYRLIEEQEWTE